ncbi:MAG: hypothetical protein A3I61_03410 [Acidobacteria bacterium RIFCSPLOWO2_02_FULL_68_18]|nr:MAG: hypothetical protein A3I61_03410 [Acidobacteria bacterium RIFCSPLOWO2_02_FULL_68_18]
MTDETHLNMTYEAQERALSSGRPLRTGRWWGPLFPMIFRGLGALDLPRWLLNLSQRVLLALLYAVSLLLLTRSVGPSAWIAVPSRTLVCRAVLVFLGLQSSAAIYAISGGMAEPLTAFCVVGHHWFFARKRYLSAAGLICFGIYFKLWPLVFVWPYLLFALLSRPHRSYIAALAGATAIIAAASLPVMDWWYGALYPVAMIVDIFTTAPKVVPTGSAEVVGLVFVVERILSGFSYASALHPNLVLVQMLGAAATILLITTTSCAAIVLAHTEQRWNTNPADRRRALLLFDATIGFCAASFSLDLSLAHLLYLIPSLYAVLLLWTTPPPTATWEHPLRPSAVVLVTAGMVLIGGLVPLSLVFRVVPLSWFDALAGNDALLGTYVWFRVPLAKYMWYEVPLFGVYLLAAALVVTWATARRRIAREAGAPAV